MIEHEWIREHRQTEWQREQYHEDEEYYFGFNERGKKYYAFPHDRKNHYLCLDGFWPHEYDELKAKFRERCREFNEDILERNVIGQYIVEMADQWLEATDPDVKSELERQILHLNKRLGELLKKGKRL